MTKKIAMLLASDKFRDIEYIVPRAFFEQYGCIVKTMSSTQLSVGRFGFKVQNDMLLQEINVADFDGIYMVGGGGSLQYLDNILVKQIFEKFLDQNKPIAAICAAPRNFLKWGLLNDKMATGFDGDGEFSIMAVTYGAKGMPEESVVIDGLILTANGPKASEESAIEYLKLLNIYHS